MRTDKEADIRGTIVALLAGAVILLVFAGAWLFKDQLHDGLDVMVDVLGITKGEVSNVIELFANIVGWSIVLGANILWLPGAVVPPWALVSLAGLCVLAAGYLWLRNRERGNIQH